MDARPVILLMHQPRPFDENANVAMVDHECLEAVIVYNPAVTKIINAIRNNTDMDPDEKISLQRGQS